MDPIIQQMFPLNNPVQPPPQSTSNLVVPATEDENLYHAMRKVNEARRGVKFESLIPERRERKEEEEKEIMEKEKEEEKWDKDKDKDKDKEKEDFEREERRRKRSEGREREFKNLFNQGLTTINNYRRLLLYLTIFAIIVECIFFEVDCLFCDVCFGESIEMQKSISWLIFFEIFFSIILQVFLYFFSNYINSKGIWVSIVLLFALCILNLSVGIWGFVNVSEKGDMIDEFNKLSLMLKQHFSNSNESLKSSYRKKMILSASTNIVLAVLNLLLGLLALFFSFVLRQAPESWRPTLRSHIRDARARRIIEFVGKFEGRGSIKSDSEKDLPKNEDEFSKKSDENKSENKKEEEEKEEEKEKEEKEKKEEEEKNN